MSDQVATIGDERGVGYMVIAYNAFNAALLALGYSTTDSRLTSDVRAKLSNAATGGDFYVFSQSFKTQSQLLGDLPAWTFGARDFIDMWETSASSGTVGPYMDIFYSTVLPDLPPSAKRDLDTVLDGGDLGGGGGSGGGDITIGDESFVPWTGGVKDGNIYDLVGQWPTYTNPAPTQRWDMQSQSSYISGLTSDCVIMSHLISGSTYNFSILDVKSGLNIATKKNQNSVLYLVNTTDSSITTKLKYYRFSVSPNNSVFTPTSGGDISNVTLSANSYITLANAGNFGTANISFAYYKGGETTTPILPPNNWPDPPSDPTPTPPTVPDPPTDTPITQPTPPTDPTPPTYPITNIYEGDTYITADISAILDAMDEHCQHLQLAIYNASNDLYDNLSGYLQDEFQATRQEIRDDFGWLGGCIHDEFESLMDYMKELFEWLADQFDFSFTGDTYNDSTVVSWLKRIYLKLGGGEVNTRPTDPVADPKGIGKWLQDLWNNFLIDLVAIGSNGLGAVAEELQKLTTKFPFSIPWDIAALLALLSASPVAPVVDVPMWSLDSGYHLVKVHDMHVDLSVYNNYWEPVRIIEKIGFALYLAMRTKDFMELLGLSSAKE